MKSLRLILLVALVLGLFLIVAPVGAQGDGQGEGTGVVWTCAEYASAYSGEHTGSEGGAFGAFGPFEEGVYVFTVSLVSGLANVSLVADPDGIVVLDGPAQPPVTFTYTMGPAGSQPAGLGIRLTFVEGEAATISISIACSGAPTGSEVAGCDTQVNLPADAVVGRFVDNAPAYWKPGDLISPQLTITVGKTLWVAGQDATGMFRKVLLSCEWVWVEAGKVGPNPDAVWNNMPLPTTVVE